VAVGEETEVKTTIEVHVYRTADEDADARHMSFTIPEGIAQAELLERGWAIDGPYALKTVEPYVDSAGTTWSLGDALQSEEHDLVTWLGDKEGHEVRFV